MISPDNSGFTAREYAQDAETAENPLFYTLLAIRAAREFHGGGKVEANCSNFAVFSASSAPRAMVLHRGRWI